MGAWCKDPRGSKMLDGEVRFGKDWVAQVTQKQVGETVVTATYIARARAYVWACVCVALCACLSVRTS